MASIKEIALLANVSQGTASMVLNGKGDQYRISAATQQKIYEAAKQLNYKPNISARRLRSGGETVLPIIALFWALDTRTALISRFLKGLQEAFSTMNEEYELLIQPFVTSRLHEVKSLITGTRFNGAIIANSSEEDEAFLEQSVLNVPIVLYQRYSEKYCFVNVDSVRSGAMVAELFKERGHKNVGVIVPDVSSKAVHQRMEGFLGRSGKLGMEVAPQHLLYDAFSEKGGYAAIHRLARQGELPSALFIISDQMAVGALAALYELGKRVPEDIEIVGHDNDDVTQFTVPPLSTVNLPVEQMAGESLRILIGLMHHQSKEHAGKWLDTQLTLRLSCGGNREGETN